MDLPLSDASPRHPARVRADLRSRPQGSAPAPAPGPASSTPLPGPAPISLVGRLAEALRDEGVAYVQWKGNWKSARWMSGEGDIDLLVDRSSEPRFSAVLWGLGFKRADPPPKSAIAGIESHFGLDPATGRLIHVHAHHR